MKSPPIGRGTVLQLTSMESLKYGGLESYFVHLARACRSRGYRTVIQFESPPASAAYLSDLADEGAIVAICRTVGSPLRSMLNILSLLRTHRPGIVQTHFVTGYGLLAVGCFARPMGARRLIALEHNPLDNARTWHRRLLYRRFDHVLGVSQAVSHSLLDAGVPPDRASTHYLGVIGRRDNDSRERARLRRLWGIPEKAIVIGCIGYDTPRKGFEILLAALRELRDDPRGVHAVIIGVDPGRSDLPARAASLGVDQRAHFVGIQDEGWRSLQAVDIYAQPSISEGIGLAIMEAMALSLPVVASRVGGIPEAVIEGTTGLLFEPGSVPGLVDALRHVLADPVGLKAMGAAGRQRYLKLFDGERSVDALVGRYVATAPSLGKGTLGEPRSL